MIWSEHSQLHVSWFHWAAANKCLNINESSDHCINEFYVHQSCWWPFLTQDEDGLSAYYRTNTQGCSQPICNLQSLINLMCLERNSTQEPADCTERPQTANKKLQSHSVNLCSTEQGIIWSLKTDEWDESRHNVGCLARLTNFSGSRENTASANLFRLRWENKQIFFWWVSFCTSPTLCCFFGYQMKDVKTDVSIHPIT